MTFAEDFRGGRPVPAALAAFGPSRALQPSPLGLRIELSATQARQGPAGLQPRFKLAGNFAVTVRYELLRADTPALGLGSGIKLWRQVDTPRQDALTLAHLRTPRGEERIHAIHGRKDAPQKRHSIRACSRRGALKLERKGEEAIFWQASGGGAFQEVFRTTLPRGEVKALRISAHTHGSAAAVALCLHEAPFP